MKTSELGYPDKMDKRTQVRTLVLDQNNLPWEKAHLALYILDAIDRMDWMWLDLLDNANKALCKGELDKFDFLLERLKKEVEWSHADDVYITRNK